MIASQRRGPAPSRPMTGVLTVPTSRLTVSDHWAVLSGTCSSAGSAIR
jgi:hypothetical protein